VKKIIVPLLCIGIIAFSLTNLKRISNFIITKINISNRITVPKGNDYEKDYSYDFVQKTDNFVPLSKQDLINILYTVLNKGAKEFSFYCPKAYKSCINDIETISNDENLFAELNNFVHPYNSFTNIKTTYSDSGEVILKIDYLYTPDQISKINTKVDEVIKKIDKKETVYNQIKFVHDEIINNTKYDVDRNKNGNSKYQSHIAYGPAYEGYATCNGYTDYMAIILSKLNYNNYKISTSLTELSEEETGHIWNAVEIDGKWLHLDLTWDDPVSTDGKDYIYHTYFLVTTEKLQEADSGQVETKDHKFNRSIYTELKN
jgi:hypothetical protein